MTTAPSTLRHVPLSSLRLEHKHWSNPRVYSGMDDAAIGALGVDLKARGIQVPLIVQQITVNGDVVDLVLEGQRRYKAALEVFSKNHLVPVIDRTAKPIELTAEEADKILLDMLSVGAKREALSAFELSESAERLRNRGRTLLEIANAIGKSESWVSKILKARTHATPKLMLQWRKGQITEEQFKELAAVPADKQDDQAKQVVEARKVGDKSEARARSKEAVATAKSKTNGVGVNGHSHAAPRVVAGPQVDMFDKNAGKAWGPDVHGQTMKSPDKKSTPSKVTIEEMVHLSTRRPPTHDYVKGLMDASRWFLGDLTPDKFAKPWTVYLARIDGSGGKPKKAKAKAARKALPPTRAKKAAKARRAKAKANWFAKAAEKAQRRNAKKRR